jgi:hypothetical protein
MSDEDAAQHKITLTVSSLSGDYTHAFPESTKLEHVVKEAIREIPLTGEGPWILEFDGKELNQEQTIEQAELKDGDVLTLNPEEGGGGSTSR